MITKDSPLNNIFAKIALLGRYETKFHLSKIITRIQTDLRVFSSILSRAGTISIMKSIKHDIKTESKAP
jgi:hypothetical protein